MAVFKAFKPEAMNKIAKAMGYSGDMGQFQSYIEQDPMRQQQMQRYTNAAMQMARGGVVKMQQGGTPSIFQNALNDPRLSDDFGGQQGGIAQGFSPSRKQMDDYAGGVGPNPYDNDPMERLKRGEPMFGSSSTAQQTPPSAARSAQQQIYPQAAVPQQQFQNIDKPVLDDDGNPTGETESVAPNIKDISAQMMQQPGLPTGATTMAAQVQETAGQLVSPAAGTVTGTVAVPTMQAPAQTAVAADETAANIVQATQSAPAVDAAVQATQAAQATLDPRAQVTAAQQTASSVGNLQAAQGNAILLNNPVQRQVQAGELISGVANAQTAAQFTEQIQAAQATPSQQATVQGQLAQLTDNFDSANPPAWAAGALRNATAVMAQRGLGASSIAGQAIVQATIEAALPIAQADAATLASFEQMNLSNRQQRSMLAAEQRAKFLGLEFDQAFQARVQNASRVADVANQNFTAEQQVALENSRAANTMNINNLSNRQAIVLAEASALANMDLSNLSNRQQASVQNAQNFLQTDMANLTNRQQTELFRAQQRVQSLFTDQAADNAARQFNASSQNQVDQFFANLNTQTSQYNASQVNAQAQFNAGQINAQERFNAEVNNQRDQFNAQNQLVIAQNNAQWRRQIATANTAAVNRANEINADAVLEMSRDGYDNLWNYYADTMEWAWTSAESQLDRYQEMAIEQLRQDKALEASNIAASTSSGSAIGNMIATLGSAAITGGLFG